MGFPKGPSWILSACTPCLKEQIEGRGTGQDTIQFKICFPTWVGKGVGEGDKRQFPSLVAPI